MWPLVTNPSPMWARNANHKDTANPPCKALTLRNHLRLASYLIMIPLVGCCLCAEQGHKLFMGGTGCHSRDRPDHVHCSEEEIESQKENGRITLKASCLGHFLLPTVGVLVIWLLAALLSFKAKVRNASSH